jgi:hypothetical protein
MNATEAAYIAVATDAAVAQRAVMAKIIDARSRAEDLRLDLDDALTELVNVTAWADDDTEAEQKAALAAVTTCRQRIAAAEAGIDALHRELVECRGSSC